MAKSPTVIGVITASIELTWWEANRHKVLAVIALLIGLYIGTHQDGTPHQPQTPRPGHSTPAPATHTPDPGSTHTVLGLPA
ncbi:hypothetical protein [Streptomyces chartreusis]|uniref:hypothetical protein n=1 Tax=Streptomyces chartreusis TaxID=1969 RepID=UPI003870D973|nr:hypothetical protein OG938_28285 [Streptomyces chartreusis]